MQKLSALIHGILPASAAGFRRAPPSGPAGGNTAGHHQTLPGNDTLFFSPRQRPLFLAGAGMSSPSRPRGTSPGTCAGGKAPDKPEIDYRATLKNDLQARVRRLQESDRELLEQFLKSPDVEYQHVAGYIATLLMNSNAGGAALEYEIGSYYATATDSRCDVLVAKVDGKIVGLCDYAPIPIDGLEADDALLRQTDYYRDGVCISNMVVSMKGQGVGTALKEAQKESARLAGYDTILGKTHVTNAKMLGLAAKNNAVIIARTPSQVWTATSTQGNDGKDG